MKRLLQLSIFSASRLPFLVWASLVSQILIVLTGGVVRLTGSGLGCPTWPKCTDESLVTVPEMGIHGAIEFANRLLTFVLALIAIWTFLTVLSLGSILQTKKLNQGLFGPALILVLGIPAQAILGGITVLTKLNPWFVGGHFVLSALLIVVASILLYRTLPPKGAIDSTEEFSRFAKINSSAIAVMGLIAVLIGVMVTGAGPHSGDSLSNRNGLDLEIWQHLHSFPAYATILLVLLQIFLIRKSCEKKFAAKINRLLLAFLLVQGVIGILQSRLGLPPVLVATHMLGASILCSLITLQFLAVHSKLQGL